MTEIVEFIKEQLAIDEQLARAASGSTVVGSIGNWQPSPAGDEWEAHDEELLVALRPGLPRPPEFTGGYWGAALPNSSSWFEREDDTVMPILEHAARHDPARVLADVEAKRAIVDAYQYLADHDPNEGRDPGNVEDVAYIVQHIAGREMLLGVLRGFATAWSDKPGFKPEWRLP